MTLPVHISRFCVPLLNSEGHKQTRVNASFGFQVKTGILSGFLELDEKLRKIPEVANGEDKSGTTAVCALITEKHVLFSNCGDSRGVLSSGGANPVLCTQGWDAPQYNQMFFPH